MAFPDTNPDFGLRTLAEDAKPLIGQMDLWNFYFWESDLAWFA